MYGRITAEEIAALCHGMVVCGTDEAGRGPLAGPVYAAAVILPLDFPREILADSKVLSEKERVVAEEIIRQRATAYAVAFATHDEIDRVNILQASLLAMARAVDSLNAEPGVVLVDGNRCPELPFPCVPIIKGDGLVPEIMAASILAKTARDRFMVDYARIEPCYHFEKHKGYPTAEHRNLIRAHGPSKIHRKSFHVTFDE